MAKRAASLIQADFDRAAMALAKAGYKPEIIFDLDARRVIVTAAEDHPASRRSDWRERAPDRA